MFNIFKKKETPRLPVSNSLNHWIPGDIIQIPKMNLNYLLDLNTNNKFHNEMLMNRKHGWDLNYEDNIDFFSGTFISNNENFITIQFPYNNNNISITFNYNDCKLFNKGPYGEGSYISIPTKIKLHNIHDSILNYISIHQLFSYLNQDIKEILFKNPLLHNNEIYFYYYNNIFINESYINRLIIKYNLYYVNELESIKIDPTIITLIQSNNTLFNDINNLNNKENIINNLQNLNNTLKQFSNQ